jgi:hypothetical protein
LEPASRCVVETGIATFYTSLSRISPGPVLARLAARIGNDEQRHYNLFSYHYRRWAEAEGTGPRALLATLHARLGELDREDIYIAMKHVFWTLHPDRPFTPADYRATRDHDVWLPRSGVGASADAPASRRGSGRWSGQDCIPTRSVGTRGHRPGCPPPHVVSQGFSQHGDAGRCSGRRSGSEGW